MNTPLTIQDFSALGNKARWAGKTDAQKRKATEKARKAHKAAAKARRLANAGK